MKALASRAEKVLAAGAVVLAAGLTWVASLAYTNPDVSRMPDGILDGASVLFIPGLFVTVLVLGGAHSVTLEVAFVLNTLLYAIPLFYLLRFLWRWNR